MLNEASDYADCYIKAMNDEDMLMADLYKALSEQHLQGYDKVRTTTAAYLAKKRTSEPMLGDFYNMVKEITMDLYNEIKKKLMR